MQKSPSKRKSLLEKLRDHAEPMFQEGITSLPPSKRHAVENRFDRLTAYLANLSDNEMNCGSGSYGNDKRR